MKIAIYDLDDTGYGNTALMKISNYHRQKGDDVEWYIDLKHDQYDKTYASSLFTFSDKQFVTDKMIVGGYGFNNSRLPENIDYSGCDYSIYPNMDYSIIWFTRGCNKHCPFCMVQNNIEEIKTLTINPKSNYLKIQDDNFMLGDFNFKMTWLENQNMPVEICNIDARLLTEEKAKRIGKLKHHKRMKMAWDNPREQIHFDKIAKWISPSKITCYVLIGYWSTPEQDLHRVETLRMLGISPFVMPYDKSDPYQRRFARWVNFKAIFKSVKWKDYK